MSSANFGVLAATSSLFNLLSEASRNLINLYGLAGSFRRPKKMPAAGLALDVGPTALCGVCHAGGDGLGQLWAWMDPAAALAPAVGPVVSAVSASLPTWALPTLRCCCSPFFPLLVVREMLATFTDLRE